MDVLRLSAAIAFVVVQAHPALAANQIITESCGMLTKIKDWLFGAVYVLGAIGLVLVAVSAFLGRFKWSHLISLGGGLFIVAMSNFLIDFASSDKDVACTAPTGT
jgi:type IV secretory pathway VirB2 component (pilin)